MDPRVAIFARAPIVGKVKTRLAESIGSVNALACYSSMLAGTIEAVADFNSELWIEGSMEDDSWTMGLNTHSQVPGDLGSKMLAAFHDGVTIIIGADVPLLSKNHIEDAINKLEKTDLVLGPTEDGGYYLIAMRTPRTALFEDIHWGSDNVLTETLKRAQSLSVERTETLWDVDDSKDYRRWLKTVAS